MVTNLKIVLADDTDMHRTLLKSTLRMVSPTLGVSFEILGEAQDGEKLVALYQQQTGVDLVFSDIRMPVMDGLSALVKIKHLNPKQKVIMASSEDLQKMDSANAQMGEEARKTLETNQKMDLLNKVAERIRKDIAEPGKTSSILTGCEKLVLDPIWVAGQYGAIGYLKKPYDLNKALELLKYVLSSQETVFKAVA